MKTYGEYLAGIFPDFKIQKISVDAGFTCPNRDGSIGLGGCSYCRNDSFSPAYCSAAKSIRSQLDDGKKFFGKKYPRIKYLAYFQRYTGTYGHSAHELEALYREALEVDGIVGLVIATRPDCLPDSILEMLSGINNEVPVVIEIGAETSHDETLHLINRNHSWHDVEDSVLRLSKFGLRCGLHLICGLPGEDEKMILQTVSLASSLPIDSIKFHQLQILYGTPLFNQWRDNKINILEFSLDEYIALCRRIISQLPDNIVIERFISQSPPELVAYPKWGLKNYQFMSKLASSFNKIK